MQSCRGSEISWRETGAIGRRPGRGEVWGEGVPSLREGGVREGGSAQKF